MPDGISPVSVRFSENERSLLKSAAAQKGMTLSEFIRREAIIAAEVELLERRNVVIPAEKWAEFEAWAARPPERVPGLVELARRRPVWED